MEESGCLSKLTLAAFKVARHYQDCLVTKIFMMVMTIGLLRPHGNVFFSERVVEAGLMVWERERTEGTAEFG